VIIVPAIAVLASIGIWWSREKYVSKGSLMFPALVIATSAYILLIFKVFPAVFSEEWSVLSEMMGTGGLLSLFTAFDRFFILILLMLAVAIYLILARKKCSERRALSIVFFGVFMFLNLALIFGLVFSGVSGYNRSDDAERIAKYINNNSDGLEYSCAALLEARTITFYTQKPCAQLGVAKLDWIKEQVKAGNLKYFVENIAYTGAHQYLSDAKTLRYQFPDVYEWMMNNTVDITTKTGLNPGSTNLRLYEYRGYLDEDK
jgi:hypothetical protein